MLYDGNIYFAIIIQLITHKDDLLEINKSIKHT